jgi:hypothetical protein
VSCMCYLTSLFEFIAEEWQRYPDNASFWHAFSDDNGKVFPYQQILNHLTECRVSAAAQDANNACTFFAISTTH